MEKTEYSICRLMIWCFMLLLANTVCAQPREKTVSSSGTITNQDGMPVAEAQLYLYETYDGQLLNVFPTDENGRYDIQFVYYGWGCRGEVIVPGYPKYEFIPSQTTDIVLYNRLDFKAGQMSTLVLPVTPDATKGRYYKPAKLDGQQITFCREWSPKANTPYVLLPNEDFSIDISDMNFNQKISYEVVTMDTLQVTLKAGLVGSYISYETDNGLECDYLRVLDSTPDFIKREGTYSTWRLAACRAYLELSHIPEPEYRFVDTPTSITTPQFINSMDDIYDLLGRPLPNKTMPKGVYIQNGRKVMVR